MGMVSNKNMAFALHTFSEGESHYIHKQFMQTDSSPNTTRNMNFALLFAVESDARRYMKKFGLIDFQPKFVPIILKEEPAKTEKKYYSTLNRGSIDESLPNFLKR